MAVPELTNPELLLLRAIIDEGSQHIPIENVMVDDQAIVVTASHGLKQHGLLTIDESIEIRYELGVEGELALEHGLLEHRIWEWISAQKNPTMQDLNVAFERHESGPGVGLLKQLGVTIDNGTFNAVKPDAIPTIISERLSFLEWIKDTSPFAPNEVDNHSGVGILGDWDELVQHFTNRRNFIKPIEHKNIHFTLTKQGKNYPIWDVEIREVITNITPELLQSEEWKSAIFKPFDVTLESATPRRGRSHPMQALIERIRSVFLEMGFSELIDDYVQTAGWNMDALFIPQDHPAREMQDTFYLKEPAKMELSEELMGKWKSIHEDGGATGSTGWGGSFSFDTAQRPLLRTHTTVNTIQYLAKHPKEACRVFSVDRVFRKEAIDRTHLPEFHQIEGIIMEEGANLQMLVTTLKTFYAKMGYPEVRVRPAYFPYTEPSLEIEVKWHGKWLELGGAGIFRPEVTEPLGIESPVLAWGMGLERLAMLVLGLDDIRQLYISDLDWLRQQPLL